MPQHLRSGAQWRLGTSTSQASAPEARPLLVAMRSTRLELSASALAASVPPTACPKASQVGSCPAPPTGPVASTVAPKAYPVASMVAPPTGTVASMVAAPTSPMASMVAPVASTETPTGPEENEVPEPTFRRWNKKTLGLNSLSDLDCLLRRWLKSRVAKKNGFAWLVVDRVTELCFACSALHAFQSTLSCSSNSLTVVTYQYSFNTLESLSLTWPKLRVSDSLAFFWSNYPKIKQKRTYMFTTD